MKNIEIDEDLYQYIASNTQYIGESASSIIRRLLASDVQVLPETNTPSATSESLAQASSLPETFSEESSTQNSNDSSEKSAKDSSEKSTENITHVEVPTAENSDVADIDSLFNYINKEELAMQRGAVGRFLLILAALHRVHKNSFSAVCEVRGRDRLYFASSESELAESGSSTKPRQIPDSPYWVITNSNTTRKKMMLTEAARALGDADSDMESIRDLL